MTSCLHNVPSVTRKGRALKAAPLQVAATGAESAVYDCLVFSTAVSITESFLPR